MKVVLDTSVLISGLFWSGAPRRVLECAIAGEFSVVTSRDLLSELDAYWVRTSAWALRIWRARSAPSSRSAKSRR
ncbi:MAG: PIN domain-containing protein [Armatimonadota bacterium]